MVPARRALGARLALGALAVAACAWFGLATRQAHDIDRAESILSAASTLSPRQAAQVNSLVDTAGTLNPDRQVDLLRGEVVLLENHSARAAAIFQRVADREPLNIGAWALVAQADFGQGRPLRLAIRRIGQLDHQFPGSG